MVGSIRLMRRKTSRPSISGILMSRTTRAARRCSGLDRRQRDVKGELVTALAELEPAALGLDQPLADRGADVDQALLHHLHGIEETSELVGRHGGRARADDDAHGLGLVRPRVAADKLGRLFACSPGEWWGRY